MRTFGAFAIGTLSLLCVACALQNRAQKATSKSQTASTQKPLSELLKERKDKRKVSLMVEKSAYRLTVLYDRKPVKQYPIVLGGNPQDDKRYEGDSCTPEGEFRIIGRRAHPRWTYFLRLNYPTIASYRKHNTAKQSGAIPQNATVGSAIGIHGVPKGMDRWIEQRENWTLGCVSLKTDAIREIVAATQVGTRVVIKP